MHINSPSWCFGTIGDLFDQNKQVILATLLFLLGSAIWSPAASADEPAVYTGKMQCSEKYAGSKTDLTTGLCWSCPTSHPKRTVFTVEGKQACEKPAHEKFAKAKGPENPTGLFKTDCRSGYFLDIGKGKCYSCPSGYNRSAYPVTDPRACSKAVKVSRSEANLPGSEGCDPGSFQHGLTGRCYTCPAGTRRNLRMGSDPSTFNACTRCGSEGDTPCTLPIVPSCDDGLVQDFLQNQCVPDKNAPVREAAKNKLDQYGNELFANIRDVLNFSDDKQMQSDIRNENATARQQAKPDINPCVSDDFNAWTLGVVTEGGVILSAAGETGMSVDISLAGRTGNQRLAEWYGGASYSLQLGGGVSGGVNYGCWRAQNNEIGGDTHGFVFDGKTVAERLGAKLPDTPATILFGVWFNPHGDGFDPEKDFQGITITPVYSKGKDLTGISYVRGTVGQVNSKKATINGTYRFKNDNRRNEFQMVGTDRFRVRALNGSSPGPWQVYDRVSDNKFKAQTSSATYEVTSSGDLIWRGSRTIYLERVN